MHHARTFLVVAFSACLPICACAGTTIPGETTDGGVPQTDGGPEAKAAIQAQVNQRAGWSTETQWTRFVAINASPAELSVASSKLNESEDAIAAMIAPYAGDQAQAQLGRLLHTRAQLWEGLVAPASAPGTSSEDALDSNAASIARFYGGLGSAFDATTIGNELTAQVHAMIAGVNMRNHNDPRQAVIAWSNGDDHMRAAADAIAAGLVNQYPDQFGPATTSSTEDAFRLKMRATLDDHVFWTRVFVVDREAKRDAQPALDRVADADVDFGNLYSQFYADDIGVTAQHQLHQDSTDSTAFVFANELADPSAIDGTSALWDSDGAAFAQFMSDTTPGLALSDTQRIVQTNVNGARAMIVSRFASQFDADASSYTSTASSYAELGDVVSHAIVTSRTPPK